MPLVFVTAFLDSAYECGHEVKNEVGSGEGLFDFYWIDSAAQTVPVYRSGYITSNNIDNPG